ncbi:MAG: hypothetical protein R2761_10380 [Acidimicrobiales bacterium]
MGNGMPFVMEKGPTWQFFDWALSPGGPWGNVAGRLEALNLLRSHTRNSWEDVFFDAWAAGGAANLLTPQLRAHIHDDWFVGLPPQNSTHGWLNFATNPVEVIVRALARAYEVSLGVTKHVELPGPQGNKVKPATPAEVTRLWPIEFWWVCPLPVFQCWIGWRQVRTGPPGFGDGLVTFTWATPAPAWSYLAARPDDPGEYYDDEVDANGKPVEKSGPLGRVDTSDRARAELYHRNMTSPGLVLVGHHETVVTTQEVLTGQEPTFRSPEPSVGDASSMEALHEMGDARMDPNEPNNKLVFKLPVLIGAGQVVTVSPFDDVGGYAEVR